MSHPSGRMLSKKTRKQQGLVFYAVMRLDGDADAETQYGHFQSKHIQHSQGSWWIPGTPGLNGRGKKTVSSRPFWGTWQNTVSKPTGLHSDLVLKVFAPTLGAIPGIPTVVDRTDSCMLASPPHTSHGLYTNKQLDTCTHNKEKIIFKRLKKGKKKA